MADEFSRAEMDYDEKCCDSMGSCFRSTWRNCHFVSLLTFGLVVCILVSVMYYRVDHTRNDVDHIRNQLDFMQQQLVDILDNVTSPVPATRDIGGVGIGPAFATYEQIMFNELELRPCGNGTVTLGCAAYHLYGELPARRDASPELPSVAA